MLRVIATRFINGNVKQLSSQSRLFSLSASYTSGKDGDITNGISEGDCEKHKEEVSDSSTIDPDVLKVSGETKINNELPSSQTVVVIEDAASNKTVDETLEVISEGLYEDMLSLKEKAVKLVIPKPDEATNRSALNMLKGLTLEMKEHRNKSSKKDAANTKIVEETLKVISKGVNEDKLSVKEKAVKSVPKSKKVAKQKIFKEIVEEPRVVHVASNLPEDVEDIGKGSEKANLHMNEKAFRSVGPTPDKTAKQSALNMLKDLAVQRTDSKHTNDKFSKAVTSESGDKFLSEQLKEDVKETVSRDVLRAFLKKTVVRSNFDLQVKKNRLGSNLFNDFDISTWEDYIKIVTLHEMEYKNVLGDLQGHNLAQNEFEVQMIDIDKEWRYPIDNEQGLGIEETTSFEDHVFLDHYLEEFPDIEPIQKYMELVITGLQQNPYISVEEKRDKIMWHKDYFNKFSPADLSMNM